MCHSVSISGAKNGNRFLGCFLTPKNHIKRTVPILVGYFISASIQPRSDTNEAFQLMAISLLA